MNLKKRGFIFGERFTPNQRINKALEIGQKTLRTKPIIPIKQTKPIPAIKQTRKIKLTKTMKQTTMAKRPKLTKIKIRIISQGIRL